MLDRHVSYLASKINFVDEDIRAMMIASRQKKDSYQGLSAPDSAGKNITAGISWHELGLLTLLSLLAHKHKEMPALLAPNKKSLLY
jgi:hypothetical protein